MRKPSFFFATIAFAGSVVAAEPTPEQAQFFESKIRPILTDKCYKCHAVETGKSKGGLVLDTREGLLKGGESGPGLKPGNPDTSLLIKAVLYTDKDLQMPPKGEKLSDHEIADLTAWVKMGAPDPRKAKGGKLSGLTDKAKQHWAFQPLKKVEIPAVKNRAWCFTQIDAFVMQKLEEKRMAPAPGLLEQKPEIGKPALLRRATYDLTGLPPTPQEIRDFLADQSRDAFAKVIDRLLASPQYGERWGRYWLDTARYSDTTGQPNARRDDYRYPYAWTYRDWVIKAFNDDLPYDQFIIQQLAADKVKDNSKENLAALGFLTVGERFQNLNDVINDRIDTTSKAFVALTVACARCHDHMFDPIPTKDYYALHGIFSSTMEPSELPLLKASLDPAKKADFDKKVAAVEEANKDKYYQVVDKEAAEVRSKLPAYLMQNYYRRNGNDAEALKKADEIAQANKLDTRGVGGLVGRSLRRNDELFGPFMRFAEAKSAEYKSVADAVSSDKSVNPAVQAAFKGAAPATLQDVANIYGKLFATFEPMAKELLPKIKGQSSASDAPYDKNKAMLAFYPFKIMASLDITSDALRAEQQRWGQQLGGRARFDFAKINELELTHEGAAARAMAVVDKPQPVNSPVFIRGQQGVPGEMVPRRFLEMFSNGKPQPYTDGSGRLELAEAIASKSNPLTTRVLMNRVWMRHFGQAFVRTPDDLGTQSEAPSHQELLDYLAGWFQEQGMSLKKLHKLIMMSHVYQEDSAPDARLKDTYAQIDPENRYLWRANIRRLDFESFRDSLLLMGGRLDKTVGGQPVNLTDEPYSYRRSVYGYVDRGNVPELMANFDFSKPDMTNSQRTTTIVPQQALFLMNSPMVVDVARRVLLSKEFRTAPADFARVQEIYLSIYQRLPKKEEISAAVQFISGEIRKQPEVLTAMKDSSKAATIKAEKKTEQIANSSSATKAIQNVGDVIDRRPLNPWETFCQALLFSNEASYIN